MSRRVDTLKKHMCCDDCSRVNRYKNKYNAMIGTITDNGWLLLNWRHGKAPNGDSVVIWNTKCPQCKRYDSGVLSALKNKERCKNCRGLYKIKDGIPIEWVNLVFKKIVRRNQERIAKGLKPHECTITFNHIAKQYKEQNGICTLSDDVLILPKRYSDIDRKISNASVDRVDNSKGYTPDNIEIVTKEMNMFKGGKSKEELERLSLKIANRVNKKKKNMLGDIDE